MNNLCFIECITSADCAEKGCKQAQACNVMTGMEFDGPQDGCELLHDFLFTAVSLPPSPVSSECPGPAFHGVNAGPGN